MMPPKSQAQARFMAMAANPKGRGKLQDEGVDVPSPKIAREFTPSGKGSVKKLPKTLRADTKVR